MHLPLQVPAAPAFNDLLHAIRTTAARQSGSSKIAYDFVCALEMRRIAVSLPETDARAFIAYCRSRGCVATDEFDAYLSQQVVYSQKAFVSV